MIFIPSFLKSHYLSRFTQCHWT